MFQSEEQTLHRVRSLLNLTLVNTKGDEIDKRFRSGGSNDAGKFAKWKKLFLHYDQDRSGVLSYKEFRYMVRHALRLSEAKLPDSDLQLLFQRIDDDHSGGIEFSEFFNYVKLKKKESEELPRTLGRALRLALRRMKVRSELDVRNLFDGLDFDADGGISLFQVRRLLRDQLQLTQHEFSEHYIKRLFHSLDANGTGQIEVDEFMKFVKDHVDLGDKSYTNYYFKEQPTGQHLTESISGVILPHIGAPPSPPKTPLASEKPAAPSPLPGLPGAEAEHAPQQGPSPRDRKLPYVGQSRREYLKIPGAEELNRVEGRLFEAGFDIRGEYFRVPDASERLPGASRARARPGRLAKIASSPAALPVAMEVARGGRDPGRETLYLREVSRRLL